MNCQLGTQKNLHSQSRILILNEIKILSNESGINRNYNFLKFSCT